MTTSDIRPDAAGPRVRFGFHGSELVAHRIIASAGYDPAHGFELSEYDVTDPFRRIRDGELDVMIVKFGLDEPDLVCGPVLATDARAAVVRAGHPLAERPSISIEDVAEYTSFERPGTMPAYVWDEVVPPTTPSGRRIERAHHVETVAQMTGLVASTDAVHVSLISLADVAPPSVRIVPIDDLPPAPVALAWRSDLDAVHVREFIAATTAVATTAMATAGSAVAR